MLKNLTNFNLTGFKRLLRQKRHYSFVGNVEEVELCYRPSDFKENISEACIFVRTEPSCTNVVKLINYLEFFVCTFKMDNSYLGASLAIMATLIMLALYFVCLYVISRYFLLPNSIVLANYFNMKNYNFGVIILGPLFTLPGGLNLAFSCNESNRSSAIIYAQAFGCLFTFFVIGMCILSYSRDFKLNPRIFMREMLFFGIAVFHIHYAVEWESQNENAPIYERSKSNILTHAYIMLATYTVYALNIILFSSSRYKRPEIFIDPESLPSSSESIDSDGYPDFYENPIEHNIDPFDLFTECISPTEAFKGFSMFLKVIMTPFYCTLALIIPVVRRQRRLNGWCKCVFCISFITYPFYFLNWNMEPTFFVSILMLGIICSLLVLFLSHNQRIPANHDLVSLWGLVLGFAIFSIIDGEVNALVWQLLTYICNMSTDAIVILISPLTYVFVEGIVLITLLKNDYRKMALGFFIGSLMFIAYSVVPVTVYSVCSDRNIMYYLSLRTTTAFYFMVIVHFITVFGLAMNGFELRRSFSIYLIITQVIYALYMILSDSEIIHPYGTLSARSVFFNAYHADWA